jgi:hypothetical protein
MPKQNGIPVNFGFTSTAGDKGITSTGFVFTGHLLQSVDYESGADKEEIRQLQGDIVSRNWYDLHTKGTFRLFIAAATKAAAITASTLTGAQPGDFISITACASHPDLIGTNWEVQSGAKIAGDVTKSAEITISCEKRAGITAAQA